MIPFHLRTSEANLTQCLLTDWINPWMLAGPVSQKSTTLGWRIKATLLITKYSSNLGLRIWVSQGGNCRIMHFGKIFHFPWDIIGFYPKKLYHVRLGSFAWPWNNQWQLLQIGSLWLWPNSWNGWLQTDNVCPSKYRLGREVPRQVCHWCNTSVRRLSTKLSFSKHFYTAVWE